MGNKLKIVGKCTYCKDLIYSFQERIFARHKGCAEIEALSEDADREMIGDDVDFGLRDIGNK